MKIKNMCLMTMFVFGTMVVSAMNNELVAQILNNHDLTEDVMRRTANASEENLRMQSAVAIALINIEFMRNIIDSARNLNVPAELEDNVHIPNDIALTDDQVRQVINVMHSPRALRDQAQIFVQLRDSNHSFELAVSGTEFVNKMTIRAIIPVILQQNAPVDNRLRD